jgi:hypothetical protein
MRRVTVLQLKRVAWSRLTGASTGCRRSKTIHTYVSKLLSQSTCAGISPICCASNSVPNGRSGFRPLEFSTFCRNCVVASSSNLLLRRTHSSACASRMRHIPFDPYTQAMRSGLAELQTRWLSDLDARNSVDPPARRSTQPIFNSMTVDSPCDLQLAASSEASPGQFPRGPAAVPGCTTGW